MDGVCEVDANGTSHITVTGVVNFSESVSEFTIPLGPNVKDAAAEIYTTSNGFIPQVRILTKHSCLELLRIIFSVNFTGDNLSDNATFQLVIFDWLLVINDMTTPTPNIPENIDESMKEAYNALLNMSSYNDFTNIDATANFILQCYKSRLLFDFLDSQDNLRRIKEMYLKMLGGVYFCFG